MLTFSFITTPLKKITLGPGKLIPQMLSAELGNSNKQLTVKPPATIKQLSINGLRVGLCKNRSAGHDKYEKERGCQVLF